MNTNDGRFSTKGPSKIIQNMDSAAAGKPGFNPRDAMVFTGFNEVRGSVGSGRSRLYLTLQLNEYIEFDDSDVLAYRSIQQGDPDWGYIVWLRKGATVEFGRIQVTELQQTFTQGDLMGQQWALPSSGWAGTPAATASMACGGGGSVRCGG